ncbi:hypothetical protein Golomagni_00693 [Golovinomyces magnicellulatus]|nr:hypothetical protein Golomagni_00693 [Golovinomyces magnicellulatus]
MVSIGSSQGDAEEGAIASKPKRVRTGCLTCRERHLKCDENQPVCNNCLKSSRICRKGVRLNFLDTTVKDPPLVLKTADWRVYFQDESRDIAAEYKGGLDKYKAILPEINTLPVLENLPPLPSLIHQSMMNNNDINTPMRHPSGSVTSNGLNIRQEFNFSRQSGQPLSNTGSGLGSYISSSRPEYYKNYVPAASFSENNGYPYLKSAQEVLFMQVFVEEVGIWMDSMDSMEHFSRQLPFLALEDPMLLNAFLACGARHLTLVNPEHYEDKALLYYDTATTQLLRAMQNPERDTVCCATTAVILNVYEIMSERAMQRMNHIAGARALIKECGWNAKSTGIGAACFWLNVGMELLSCLHFNWQVAWEPDQWGVDLNFQREYEFGSEEIWIHRILYIVGKIANFRASTTNFQESLTNDEQTRVQDRFTEWLKLRSLCDSWNQSIPRTMRPIGYLHPSQTTSHSAFPEVWLIKRATVVGRLFYHTAMILLAQAHPLKHRDSEEMKTVQLDHAHMICGITAHVKDRGVASVALRSLAIAAECLVIRQEQEEILEIFEKIRKETGWKVGLLYKELRSKWGWDTQEIQQSSIAPLSSLGNSYPAMTHSAPSYKKSMPSGILNPLLAKADFSLPNHPYQQYYQPPSQNNL